jgi:hypothetical protein
MKVFNVAKISEDEFANLRLDLLKHKTLGHVLAWANSKPKADVIPQTVAEVITQDEFTHDAIVPYRKAFLVYDTT